MESGIEINERIGMRKAEKKEVLNFVNSFYQAHEEIKEALNKGNMTSAQIMLGECQEFAIQLGNMIERLERKGHITVSYVEKYCEVLFRVYELIGQNNINVDKLCRQITKLLIKTENSIKNDIAVRKEIVFFSYKASMWDSLESVYLAAREDPDCDVYCVPIPYYDLRLDRTLGQMHYEGHEYPEGIEVIDWQSYKFEERRPDVIYIHNPYDNWNLVTSVHPRFYSENLKKYTETLVYIPYYSTTGGMSEGQKLCPAYIYVDYIITQASGFREYFDERIPDEKFLPLGSPKFDRIIRKCQNPPEPPSVWKVRMEGRKVYFYNTSIHGMLTDTEDFLKKMRYVFSCFEGRADTCLLWRPHPLLESTFDSMRPMYKQKYLLLKKEFFDKELGIYDATPDMEDTIALCDAYIGDAASSVISLFGIAGKPLFILNNKLHSEPKKDSWQGEINVGLDYFQQDRFTIIQGNKLYVSKPFAHDYKYFCDLSDYIYSGDYNKVFEMNQKLYVCPQNAQDILIIDDKGKKNKIQLEQMELKTGAFNWSVCYKKYIILLPYKYPAIVVYDTTTRKIKYLRDYIDVFTQENDGTVKFGGCAIKSGKCYLTSITDRQVYVFDIETRDVSIVKIPVKAECGYMTMISHKDDLWLLPCEGKRLQIVQWNPELNEAKEYWKFPEGFQCENLDYENGSMKRPFSSGMISGHYLYLAPDNANMYVRLNIDTGEMEEWKPPFDDGEGEEYFYTTMKSFFFYGTADEDEKAMIFSYPKRKLYEINFKTNVCSELEVHFDMNELIKHEPGFCYHSEGLRYCCCENSFNSIRNFLDGTITGNLFDREKQIEAYKAIASNNDGTCGIKIHEFMRNL